MKPIKVYACLFPTDFIFPVGKVTFALELRFCAFRHTHVLLLYILKKNSWREKMRCFLSPFHSRRPRVEICEWSSSLAWPKKHFLQSSTFFAKMIIRLLKKDRFDLHNFLHTFMDRQWHSVCKSRKKVYFSMELLFFRLWGQKVLRWLSYLK